MGFGIKADVVPCLEYRKYKRFPSLETSDYTPGISFYKMDGESLENIISYPKPHLDNCSVKNDVLDGKFKNMVRVFKNLRLELIQAGAIQDKDVCGYYIENMLYNCREICYQGNYDQIFLSILNNVYNDHQKGNLLSYECPNEEQLLFSDTEWTIEKAIRFVEQCYLYYTS